VGDVVSAMLCNKRSMALGSYIDALLFEPWREGIVFKPTKSKKKVKKSYTIMGIIERTDTLIKGSSEVEKDYFLFDEELEVK
jgi:hypothetical protein